jgi:hypothetical protein
MDAFEIGVLALVAAAVLGCCLAARMSSGRRWSELGDGRRRRRPSQDLPSDAEDLQDMLAVTNSRRRARGLPERSVDDAIREFGGD